MWTTKKRRLLGVKPVPTKRTTERSTAISQAVEAHKTSIRALQDAPRLRPETHKVTECKVMFKQYSARSFPKAAKKIFFTCQDLGSEYVKEWVEYYASDASAVIWTAEDFKSTGFVRGYVAGRQHGKHTFLIDIVCSKDRVRANRQCKNVMIHLLHYIETILKHRGYHQIVLQSVPGAVGFYTRLGYRRTLTPCGQMPNSVKLQAEHLYKNMFSRKLRDETRVDVKYKGSLQGKFFKNKNGDGLIFMSKCLQMHAPAASPS